MWDIKSDLVATTTAPLWFYPNHVGYKGLFARPTLSLCLSFIRTMWDIKVTQLHEKEMVLPAEIAEPLRDMLAERSITNNYGGNSTIVVNALTGAYGVREALKATGKHRRAYVNLKVGE